MLEITNLRKCFGDHTAVDNVSFNVQPGRITGFVGPNGAGKTTTMRMMTGLIHPDRGSALFGGRRYPELDCPLKTVGTLIDGANANPREKVASHLHGLAIANDIARSRVGDVLDAVGLSSAARKRVGALSLGMGQRLALAEVLLGEPEYVILDEPFIGLDVDGTRWLRSLLLSLVASGAAVLLSNHQMAEMQMLADDLVMIGSGQIIMCGPTSSLLSHADPGRLMVRCDHPAELAAVLRQNRFLSTVCDGRVSASADGRLGELHRLLDSLGVRNDQIEEVPPTLEDIFVDTMHSHAAYVTTGATQ